MSGRGRIDSEEGGRSDENKVSVDEEGKKE